jgi:hypothetical protein
MSILIDNREGSSDLPTYPPLNTSSHLCTLTRLSSGDVCFAGNGPDDSTLSIGIEIKSLNDLLQSSFTGRLQGVDGQLQRMLYVDCYNEVWLLYYGLYRCSDTGYLEYPRYRNGSLSWLPFTFGASDSRPVPFSYLTHLLMSLGHAGVKFDHVGSKISPRDCKPEVAAWVLSLYTWWQKPYTSHGLLRSFNNASSTLTKPLAVDIDPDLLFMAKLVAPFPGVQFERAVAIAESFPSAQAMFNAGVDEWAEVRIPTKGKTGRVVRLGKTMAQAIVERIRRRRNGATGTAK